MKSDSLFMKFLKPAVFILCFFPLMMLILQAVTEGLGANPVEKILHTFWDWTLNFLMITLAVSPFYKITGLTWPVRLRRMLGLFSFFYATLHVLTYAAVDQFFSWDAIVRDIARHKRIIAGLASYILLIPLAVTSTNNMVKRLGFRQWQILHRLIYPAVIGGVIHFLWLVKKDMGKPLIYAGILLFLFGVKIAAGLIRKNADSIG